MKNPPKTPGPVILGILTVITIIFWIGFEVFRSFTKTPEPEIPAEILAPLSPEIDAGELSKLQNRVFLNEAEIGNPVVQEATSAPTPTPEASPEASPATESGQPSPIPEATEGGQVVNG